MKKLNLIFGILMILMTSSISFGQEYEMAEKTVTGVFEIEGKNKSELFSSINKWISINYNSAQNVIQMNDKEAGTIIIKGINEVVYKNSSEYSPEYSTTKLNHLIEINIKDNRYRVVYKITDVATEDFGFNSIFLKCISFNGENEQAILDYSQIMDENLKKVLVGKKKREKFMSTIKPMFEELNNNVISDIKSTMKSIEKTVESKNKDDW